VVEAAAVVAADAALVAADAADAAMLVTLTSLLPVLDASNSLVNLASDLSVNVTSEFGNGRNIAFNKYNDVITVEDDKIVIIRVGDYKDINFISLGKEQKRVLMQPSDLYQWSPTLTGIGAKKDTDGYNGKPSQGVVLRHFAANDFNAGSTAVTKLFVPTGDAIYCWDYDDSTREKAYLGNLSNGRILVNKTSYGIDTGYDWGPTGHIAHDIIFDHSGNLYISTGSVGNIEVCPADHPQAGQLSDERTSVKYVTDASLKALLNDPDAAPLNHKNDLELLARGLRNASGLSLDASNNIWAIVHGWDSMDISGVVARDDAGNVEPLWNSHPAETIYKLSTENSSKRYGFPYGFISAKDLSVNGVTVSKNSLVHLPSSPIVAYDAFGRSLGPFVNPITDLSLAESAEFVQNAQQILPKSSAAITAVFNQAGADGYVTYDGRSDKRLNKVKTIAGNFALITAKGSWNKRRGSGGEGFKVVSMDLSDAGYDIKDFYNNPTFSSGFDETAGLGDSGVLLGAATAPSVYRPTGVGLDKNGSVVITSNYNWMTPPNRGGTLVHIYNNNV
jgi:hypothetical protein